MTTSKNDETYLLTQPLLNTNATVDGHNPLESFPMNSSKKKKIFFYNEITYFYLDREPKRSRTIVQPKGTIPYTV
jgi:hypothetical protein